MAVQAAVQELNESPLNYFINVARARLSGVRPLPLRIATDSGWEITREQLDDSQLTAAPDALGETVFVAESAPTPAGKIAQWERKLLELGLRNMLINLRVTQNVIPILSPSLVDLEDALADGSEYGIGARPAEWQFADEDRKNIERMTVLRKAVMDQHGWDVLESAFLGIFSFSQFVMWNDLRNRLDDLQKNKIVRSLIDGKLTWDAQPMEIGGRVSEEGVLLPIPADASQLYAIESAERGDSFVLHGPPGTGKSQTITAMIANVLAQGKRVLFVAEKMAALSVVQRRLEAMGIGPSVWNYTPQIQKTRCAGAAPHGL